MIDSSTALEHEILLLKTQVTELAFDRCTQIAQDYTRFFVIAQDERAILINELFQDVFGEMHSLVSQFNISKQKTTEIKHKVSLMLQGIVTSFTQDEVEHLFNSLRDLRVYMTNLQFQTWYTTESKRRGRGIHGSFGDEE